MIDILLLHFDAPLISFGAPIVDNFGVIQPMPALSMLTGLLANALGYDHREPDKLQRLQERLRFAARCDRPGRSLRDYQTVDLGQPFLDHDLVAWTTWGHLDPRKGASDKDTHIRYRDYWADSIYTVAIALVPAEELPDLSALTQALEEPARPLFFGRKCCLPATPLLAGTARAESLLEALREHPRLPTSRTGVAAETMLGAWWSDADIPTDAASSAQAWLVPVTDERDWRNQIHCGRRVLHHGLIDPPEGSHE